MPALEPIFDKPEQYNAIVAELIQGEGVIAVQDAIGVGTGFIGLTTKRVVLQDNSFVGKKTALTSVPYRNVTAVSFVSDKSILGKWASTSSIAISVGARDYPSTSEGKGKAKHVHEVVLWHIAQ